MARAIEGDYNISNGLRELDLEEMTNYKCIDKIDKYNLFKLDKSEHINYQQDYILGYFKDNKFKKIAKIYFNKIGEFYEVDTIYVSSDMRGNGVASKLYTYFAKELNYKILGSDMQRFGARRLWSKLSKHEDLSVDILDFKSNEIIESSVQVYHGPKDEEFDKRVWSYESDKKHIRLILKNIKDIN